MLMNVGDLQNLREEMLICLMSRGNSYQTSGRHYDFLCAGDNKVIFTQWKRKLVRVHMCLHVCVCAGLAGWLAGWFCSC